MAGTPALVSPLAVGQPHSTTEMTKGWRGGEEMQEIGVPTRDKVGVDEIGGKE